MCVNKLHAGGSREREALAKAGKAWLTSLARSMQSRLLDQNLPFGFLVSYRQARARRQPGSLAALHPVAQHIVGRRRSRPPGARLHVALPLQRGQLCHALPRLAPRSSALLRTGSGYLHASVLLSAVLAPQQRAAHLGTVISLAIGSRRPLPEH